MAKAVRVRVSPTAPNKKSACRPPIGGLACAGTSGEHIQKMNLDQYLPVFLFILVGIAVGIVPLLLGYVLGPNRPDPEKNSPYECGFEAFEDARMKFDVRYYLIAILFILFDLEIAFLFPWAAIYKDIVASDSIKLFGFIEMLVFVTVLVIGYIYAWAKGALEWE